MLLEKDAFKYCPVCEGEFENLSDIHLRCKQCGYNYFISANPCAGGIITNNKGQILVIKRENNPHKGMWDIPAGFVDGQETFEEALKREILEEAGLEIKNYKYFGSYTGEYEMNGVIKFYLTAVFTIQIGENDKVRVGDDAGEYKFIDPKEIDFSEFGFESTKKILKDYIAFSG